MHWHPSPLSTGQQAPQPAQRIYDDRDSQSQQYASQQQHATTATSWSQDSQHAYHHPQNQQHYFHNTAQPYVGSCSQLVSQPIQTGVHQTQGYSNASSQAGSRTNQYHYSTAQRGWQSIDYNGYGSTWSSSQEPCYNCGLVGHLAQACSEPRRDDPAYATFEC